MNHNRLKCYEVLLNAAKKLPALTSRWPRGSANLKDQMMRAMISSALNTAEGNGRWSIKERRRFFEIALASIDEVLACLDIALALQMIDARDGFGIQSELKMASKMLARLRER